MLLGRSNAEINLLKTVYTELYNEDLVAVLGSYLSGYVSGDGDLKTVVLMALRGEVEEFDAAVYTPAKASADADALYKAGEGKWGTDEDTFVGIVLKSPPQHLVNIDAAYAAKFKSSVLHAVKEEFSGNSCIALVYYVRWVLERDELLADLSERALKSATSNNLVLSVWLVRYSSFLTRICVVYKKKYGVELRERIQSVASDSYGSLLLLIFDAAISSTTATEVTDAADGVVVKRKAEGSAWWRITHRRLVKTWLPQFVSYVQRRGKSFPSLSKKELLNFARDFCDKNFVSFEDGFFSSGTLEEKRASWIIARSLSFHYPGVAVQELGLGVGAHRRTLVIDELTIRKEAGARGAGADANVVVSMLQVSPRLCAYYEDVILLENGEVKFHGSGATLVAYFRELGFQCPPGAEWSEFLLNLNESEQVRHRVTMIEGFNNQRQLRRSTKFGGLVPFADDTLFLIGSESSGSSAASTPASSPMVTRTTTRIKQSPGPRSSPGFRRTKATITRGSPSPSKTSTTRITSASPASGGVTEERIRFFVKEPAGAAESSSTATSVETTRSPDGKTVVTTRRVVTKTSASP